MSGDRDIMDRIRVMIEPMTASEKRAVLLRLRGLTAPEAAKACGLSRSGHQYHMSMAAHAAGVSHERMRHLFAAIVGMLIGEEAQAILEEEGL